MKRNGNIWPKVLLGLIGGVAAIWIIIVSLGAAGTREWEAYAASLRAKGQPLTFAEIEARRAVIADDQNSARVIELLADELKAIESNVNPDVMFLGSKNEGADFFEGIYRGKIAASREFLARHAGLLAQLRTVENMPMGHFGIDYNREPHEIALPDLSRLRNASKLVILNHTLNLIDGNAKTSVEDTQLLCRLSGTLFDEPTLISRLVQIAIENQAIQSVENLLRSSQMNDASINSLSNEMLKLRQRGTIRWAMLGERAFFSATCESLIGGTVYLRDLLSGVVSDDIDNCTGLTWRMPAFLVRSNQLRGTQMLTWLVDAGDDSNALRAAAQKIDGEIQNLPRTQILVKSIMPSLSRAVALGVKIGARIDCTMAALAAERFRLAEGRFPSTLEQLVPVYLPSVPIDPFDGKPLRMSRAEQGIVVYSVDENGIDDGGDVVIRKEGNRKRSLDVGFRLNDVDHRGVLLVDDPPKDED